MHTVYTEVHVRISLAHTLELWHPQLATINLKLAGKFKSHLNII